MGSVPKSGSSPGEGHGNPLQYSCLENSMDRRAWCTTVHGLAKSQTRLSTHSFQLAKWEHCLHYGFILQPTPRKFLLLLLTFLLLSSLKSFKSLDSERIGSNLKIVTEKKLFWLIHSFASFLLTPLLHICREHCDYYWPVLGGLCLIHHKNNSLRFLPILLHNIPKKISFKIKSSLPQRMDISHSFTQKKWWFIEMVLKLPK